MAVTHLEAIVAHLATAGHGTAGTNLFASRMPDQPDVCLCVFETEGFAPHETMGALAAERPGLQVLARAGREDYPVARDLALAVRATLIAITDQTLSGVRILRVKPSGYISPAGVDDKDRPLVTANFEVQFA